MIRRNDPSPVTIRARSKLRFPSRQDCRTTSADGLPQAAGDALCTRTHGRNQSCISRVLVLASHLQDRYAYYPLAISRR